MEARYVTDETGKRIGVLPDIKEYERLREIEEEAEDLEALRAARETKSAIESGEEEVVPWDQAMKELRGGKITGG